jgi:serine/threonine-protein kinase RsbT
MAPINTPLPIAIPVRDDAHAVIVSLQASKLAAAFDFPLTVRTALSTAVLEIARNIVKYAGGGEVTLDVVESGTHLEFVAVASDKGPGIPDLELAMQDGYSTGNTLGLGLPGARRLMDSFEIITEPGQGTTIIMKKVKV